MTDCAAAARNLVKAVPLGARLTALACVGVLASGLSAGPDSEPRVCLMPGELLDTPWTLLSAPFVHLSPLHLAANLLSLATLAPRHERALGTLASLWACMVLSLASGLLGACIALLSDELVSHGWARSCSAGLSGYLFALLAADSIEHREPRQLFGAVRIHAAAFPWAVLVAVQVLVPAASFVAHLGGLAAGFAFAYGLLAWAMPRGAWIVALESAPGVRAAARWACFAPYPGPSLMGFESLSAAPPPPRMAVPTPAADAARGRAASQLSIWLSTLARIGGRSREQPQQTRPPQPRQQQQQHQHRQTVSLMSPTSPTAASLFVSQQRSTLPHSFPLGASSVPLMTAMHIEHDDDADDPPASAGGNR